MDLTIENAEFLGIFVGDGSLHVRPEKAEFDFKFVGNPKDEFPYYFERVSKLASNLLGRQICPSLMDKGRSIGIRFCSKELALCIGQIGIPKDKLNFADIPTCFLASKELTAAFIRGVFDTDGCFTIKKRYRKVPYYPCIEFGMKNKVLLGSIAIFINKYGISSSLVVDQEYIDKRNGQKYTKNYLCIYGIKNVIKWFDLIGTSNPKIKEKWRNFISPASP
ncbi:MAG: LAGLIDADG family homing endonuclease [Candidatus Micrarchaeota archaeon]